LKHPVQQKNRQQDSRSTRGELTGRVLPTMSAGRRDSVQCSTYGVCTSSRLAAMFYVPYGVCTSSRLAAMFYVPYRVCTSSRLAAMFYVPYGVCTSSRLAAMFYVLCLHVIMTHCNVGESNLCPHRPPRVPRRIHQPRKTEDSTCRLYPYGSRLQSQFSHTRRKLQCFQCSPTLN